jgi:hypothetical protein
MFGSRTSFSSAISEPESPFLRPWPSQGSNADFFSPAPSSARGRSQAEAFEASLVDELSRRLSQARALRVRGVRGLERGEEGT